jgi:hypothetical protein
MVKKHDSYPKKKTHHGEHGERGARTRTKEGEKSDAAFFLRDPLREILRELRVLRGGFLVER